jgi:exodeoxyribonuclease-3
MRIATVNANGLRAAFRKGGADWLGAIAADVIAVQEVRAPDALVRDALEPAWAVVHDESAIAGRAGAALLVRGEARDPVVRLPGLPPVPSHTGRWAEGTVATPAGDVRAVSVYVHSGQAGTPKMDDKYAFLDAMTARMRELLAAHERVVVMGDINIAHGPRDLKNSKGNLKTAGFLAEERAYLDAWLADGWVDVHRTLAGDVDGPYTWWSQRGKAFDNDVGWRLDYQFASPQLAALASDARVERAASWDTRWSDHAPLIIDYGPWPSSGGAA